MKKYENFVRALANLASSNRIKPPYSPVEQAGIVKLFEICYEQAWKMMKEIMGLHQYDVLYVNGVINTKGGIA